MTYTTSKAEELVWDAHEFELQRSRYLDLVKACLLRTVFPDANRNPEGETLPFDAAARREGRLYPTEAFTMVGALRLESLERACLDVLRQKIPGDFVECGVWRGGCAILMRAVLRDQMDMSRRVWLFDSFMGAPRPTLPEDEGDTHWTYGHIFAVPLDEVRANFASLNLLDRRVLFRPGWFQETLPAAVDLERIAVLRLDGDLYESTIQSLDSLYPKVSVGGYVLIDDYYVLAGVRRAIDEYRERQGIRSPLVPVDWNGAFWKVNST